MNELELESKIWKKTVLQSEIDKFFNPINGDKSELINRLLLKAYIEKNGSAIDDLLQCIYINGKEKSHGPILCRISEVRDNWQYMNEDIATLLGDIKSEESVKSLLNLALDYPISNIHSIPLKAIWAIRNIGNEEAIKALKNISKCGDEKKMKMAREQIEYYFKPY